MREAPSFSGSPGSGEADAEGRERRTAFSSRESRRGRDEGEEEEGGGSEEEETPSGLRGALARLPRLQPQARDLPGPGGAQARELEIFVLHAYKVDSQTTHLCCCRVMSCVRYIDG